MVGPEAIAGPVSRQQVVQSMVELLVRILRTDVPITESSRLMEELGMTSSQGMELTLALEDDLSIMIDVEELDDTEMSTVGDLAGYIVTHAAPR